PRIASAAKLVASLVTEAGRNSRSGDRAARTSPLCGSVRMKPTSSGAKPYPAMTCATVPAPAGRARTRRRRKARARASRGSFNGRSRGRGRKLATELPGEGGITIFGIAVGEGSGEVILAQMPDAGPALAGAGHRRQPLDALQHDPCRTVLRCQRQASGEAASGRRHVASPVVVEGGFVALLEVALPGRESIGPAD